MEFRIYLSEYFREYELCAAAVRQNRALWVAGCVFVYVCFGSGVCFRAKFA